MTKPATMREKKRQKNGTYFMDDVSNHFHLKCRGRQIADSLLW